MTKGIRYGRLDTSSQICENSSGVGPVSACGSNYNGDSVLYRVMKIIEAKVYAILPDVNNPKKQNELDGWQYRRCLNKPELVVPNYTSFTQRTAMEKSGDNFKWNGLYLSDYTWYWNYIKRKYGNLGLPDKFEDHKDLDGNALELYDFYA